MFSTSVGHFVKAVGKDSFVPVPSLDLADNVKLLQVVVKKNRFWFWQKPTYKPTDFSLDDLLKDGAKVDLPSKTHVLVEDYNPSYNIAVNGKFGAELCKELIHVEIDADDEIKLDVRFGDVQKTEVDDIPKLVRALDSVQLDLDNPFLRQLRKDSKKTLCIIVGVANLSKDSELSSELKFDNDGEISATVTGRARVSVDDEKTKTFTIPGGTSIAYNVCELLVTTSGTPRLVVIEGLHGGFEAADEADCPRSPALSATDESSVILFKGILTMNPAERASFTADVLDIMATPRLAEPILNQLRAAYRSINNIRNSHSDVMLHFLKRTIVSKKTTWQSILKTAGFGFQADGRVSYPGENSPRLESCRALFKALCELEDEEISSLRSCDPSLAKPLHNLLHDAILKYPIKTTNERFSPIFSNDNAAVTLLKELGFVIHDSAADPPQENVYSLQAAEKVVFALWGTSDM